MDNDTRDHANRQADDFVEPLFRRAPLARDYERAYDLLSRLWVWFVSPPPARAKSAKSMYQMVKEFMQTAHDPYSDDIA